MNQVGQPIVIGYDYDGDGKVDWFRMSMDERRRVAQTFAQQHFLFDGIDIITKLTLAAFVFMASMALNTAFAHQFSGLRNRGRWVWAAISVAMVVGVALFIVGYEHTKSGIRVGRVQKIGVKNVDAPQLNAMARSGGGIGAMRTFIR